MLRCFHECDRASYKGLMAAKIPSAPCRNTNPTQWEISQPKDECTERGSGYWLSLLPKRCSAYISELPLPNFMLTHCYVLSIKSKVDLMGNKFLSSSSNPAHPTTKLLGHASVYVKKQWPQRELDYAEIY